jgi:Dynamin GTPase effector domain
MLFGTFLTFINSRNIVISVTQTLAKIAVQSASEHARMESRPFTLDTENLAITKLAVFGEIQGYRRTERKGANKTAPDEYLQELDAISYILAYIGVAYRRFGDMIPMRVDETFLQRLTTTLQTRIWKDLGVTGDGSEERCAAFFEESAGTAAKRHDLHRRLGILKVASEELSQFRPS